MGWIGAGEREWPPQLRVGFARRCVSFILNFAGKSKKIALDGLYGCESARDGWLKASSPRTLLLIGCFASRNWGNCLRLLLWFEAFLAGMASVHPVMAPSHFVTVPVHVGLMNGYLRMPSLHLRMINVYLGMEYLHLRMAFLHFRMPSLHLRMINVYLRMEYLHLRMAFLHFRMPFLHLRMINVYLRMEYLHLRMAFLHLRKINVFLRMAFLYPGMTIVHSGKAFLHPGATFKVLRSGFWLKRSRFVFRKSKMAAVVSPAGQWRVCGEGWCCESLNSSQSP